MTDFKRVYVDTSPFIYYLENSALYRDRIKRFFEMCLENRLQRSGGNLDILKLWILCRLRRQRSASAICFLLTISN